MVFADPVRLRLLNLLSASRRRFAYATCTGPWSFLSRLSHATWPTCGSMGWSSAKEGLWVHYRLARPTSGLHRILFGCLGNCLGDPEVFAQDRLRLKRLLGCCGAS